MSRQQTLRRKQQGKTKRQLRQRRTDPQSIQHHHLVVRCETAACPDKNQRSRMADTIDSLIHSIRMEHLAPTTIYYMTTPRVNEGMTAITPIKTSHISFHFWRRPERKILHNPESKCLLQMDVYTCGTMSKEDIKHILTFLQDYGPCHIDLTLLNRRWGLSIERALRWDKRHESWGTFLANF